MSSTTWAAFDIPADPPQRERRVRGRFRRPPERVLRADTPGQVPAVVAAAEAAAMAGNWVLGGLRYPAAGAWDAAQLALPDVGPAATFEVYPGPPEPWPEDPVALPALDWRPDAELAGGRTGEEAVATVLDHIAAGDCYQVNLTTSWRASTPGLDLFAYFESLAAAQPGGYAVFSATAGVASVSPELFFHRRGEDVVTQPMKGTAPASADPAVLGTPKERAENLMIVDLIRNDVSRIALPHSVSVPRLFSVEAYPTVWQMTSTVTADIGRDVGLEQIFAATFPCGSVTGAPKIEAMKIIAELETQARGIYCGAIGMIRPGGDAVFNVAIRTLELNSATARGRYGVGSGITADSTASMEYDEVLAKCMVLEEAAPAGRLSRAARTADEPLSLVP